MKWSLTTLLICLLCNSIVSGGPESWPTFQHDPQHSGYSSSDMPEHLKEVWVTEHTGAFYGASPGFVQLVISEDKLIVAQSTSLSALDIKTGSVLWSRIAMISLSCPAIKTKRVYTNGIGAIFCCDADTGENIWSHAEIALDFQSFPLFVDGNVIVGGGRPLSDVIGTQENLAAVERAEKNAKRVVCLNAENGEVIWEFFANNSTSFSPAYFKGRIYINDGFRGIYCLDAQSGTKIWEKRIEWTNSTSLSLDGKRIFVGTYHGIICLDLETGEELWKFECNTVVSDTPSVAYDKVFAPTNDGVLYCLDAENGEVVWKIENESRIFSSVIVADTKVAYGTENGVLCIANAQSGEICESHDLGDSAIGALALSNGMLFAGQENGRISCFDGDNDESAVPGFNVRTFLLISIPIGFLAGIFSVFSLSKAKEAQNNLH